MITRRGIGLLLIALSATPCSAGVESEAPQLRRLAASYYYTQSVPRAGQLLNEARLRVPGTIEEARALDLYLEVLFGSGLEYSKEVRTLSEQALDLKERLWGRQHPEYARTLVLAARLMVLHTPGVTRDMLEQALAIQERSLPKDDLALAETYFELWRVEANCGTGDGRRYLMKLLDAPQPLADLSDPATAERLIWFAANEERELCEERLSELLEKIRFEYGPGHPLIARVLEALAACQDTLDRPESILANTQQGLAILRAAFGPTHHKVAESTLALASMIGGFDQPRAGSLYRQGIESYTKLAGENSPLLRYPLLWYAEYLADTKHFDEAFDTATRAFSLGPPGFDVRCPRELEQLAKYAGILRRRGEWAEAKAFLEPIVEKSDAASIGDSVPYAEVLNWFGDILATLGDDSRARGFLERALAMRERVSGPEYISNWIVLTNLGGVIARIGDLDTAEVHLKRALRLLTERYGPDHRCVPMVLRLLADVQARRGDTIGSRETLLRALPISQAAYGDDGGRTDLILRDLCRLQATGDLGRDSRMCARAIGVVERRYGPHHPEIAHLLSLDAASILASDDKAALRLSIDAERRWRAHFARTVRTLSEREALNFEVTKQTALDVALSVLARKPGTPSGPDVRRVWDEVVRSRAMVLDESITRRRALSGGDLETRQLFQKLESARSHLSRALLRSVDADAAASRAETEAAVAAVDAAERSWTSRQRARGASARGEFGIDEVLMAAPRDAAVVAYVRYRRLDPSPLPRQTLEYAALIAPARRGPVEFVRLGDAERIDRLVAGWSRAIESEPAPGLGHAAERAYRDAAAQLREAIWDPLRTRLGSPSLVLLVPEGSLHLVAFGTLPAEEDRYLVETAPPIQLLSTERDVAAIRTYPAPAGGLLAVGNPAFDATVATAPSSASYRSSPACMSLSLQFAPLFQAAMEVEEVRRAWLSKHDDRAESAVTLLGDAATEEEFKRRAPSSRVIHLATHAFVLPPECTELARGRAAAGDSGWLTVAGLAFAGANRRDRSTSGASDGILTTDELAALDLSRTDWVVLSACASGLGSVRHGEGVFGLRRALQIVGARTTIMSLWQVRDDAARDWMGRLYRARMDGASTASSVRFATLGTLESRRSRGLDTHPGRWGTFVAVGDWR